MKCLSCNNEIPQEAKFCPYCGKQVLAPNERLESKQRTKADYKSSQVSTPSGDFDQKKSTPCSSSHTSSSSSPDTSSVSSGKSGTFLKRTIIIAIISYVAVCVLGGRLQTHIDAFIVPLIIGAVISFFMSNHT